MMRRWCRFEGCGKTKEDWKSRVIQQTIELENVVEDRGVNEMEMKIEKKNEKDCGKSATKEPRVRQMIHRFELNK